MTAEDKGDFSGLLFKGVDQRHLQGGSSYYIWLPAVHVPGPHSEVGPGGLLLNCILSMAYRALSDLAHVDIFSLLSNFHLLSFSPTGFVLFLKE